MTKDTMQRNCKERKKERKKEKPVAWSLLRFLSLSLSPAEKRKGLRNDNIERAREIPFFPFFFCVDIFPPQLNNFLVFIYGR